MLIEVKLSQCSYTKLFRIKCSLWSSNSRQWEIKIRKASKVLRIFCLVLLYRKLSKIATAGGNCFRHFLCICGARIPGSGDGNIQFSRNRGHGAEYQGAGHAGARMAAMAGICCHIYCDKTGKKVLCFAQTKVNRSRMGQLSGSSGWNDRSILMSDYWPVTVNRQKSAPFVRGNISTRVFSLISSGFPIDLFPRTDMLFRFIRTYPMYTNTRKRSFYQHFSIS